MEIENLKTGMKAVDITVQIRGIGEIREFERMGTKGRVATAAVEDSTGSIDLPLFNEEIDAVKVGDVIRVANGYIGEFNGLKQLRAGKYGKIIVVTPVEGKKNPEKSGPKKVEKKLKIPQKEVAQENWCKKCGKTQDPKILGDYDGMCVPCWKGAQEDIKDDEYE